MRVANRFLIRAFAVTAGAAMATTLLVVPPAQAGDRPMAGTQGAASEIDEVLETLEPFVSRSVGDGTFSLDAPSEVIEDVGHETYSSVEEAMEAINSGIRSGALESREDLTAVPTGTAAGPDGAEIMHHGVNNLTCSWVNCTLRLDDYWTPKLVAAMAGASAAAAIAAVLAAAGVITSPGAIPSGLAAGILALGSATVSFCSNSHGVWIRVGVGAWCGGQ